MAGIEVRMAEHNPGLEVLATYRTYSITRPLALDTMRAAVPGSV